MINLMDRELFLILMEINIRDNFKMVLNMEKGYLDMQMEIFMMEIGEEIRRVVMELILIKIWLQFIVEIGEMGRNTVKEFINLLMVIFIMENLNLVE